MRDEGDWAKIEILVWCRHGKCPIHAYGDTLTTAAGRVRTFFAANPEIMRGESCFERPYDWQKTTAK